MKILQIRRVFTPESTISSLLIDGEHECYILENPIHEGLLGPAHIAIQVGTYPVIVRYSEHFHRRVLGLTEVPGRTNIEVHPGNSPKDTHGCLLPGTKQGKDCVMDSVKAESALFVKVVVALGTDGPVTWEIREAQEVEVAPI